MRPLLSADVLPARDLQAGLPESLYVSTFVLQTVWLLQQRSGVLRSPRLRPLVRPVVRPGVRGSRAGWLRCSGSPVLRSGPGSGPGDLRRSGSDLLCSRTGSGPGDLRRSGSGHLLRSGPGSGDVLCSGSGPGQMLRHWLQHGLQQWLQQRLRLVLQAEVLQC